VVAKLLESLSSHPAAKTPVKPSGADGSSSTADSKQAEREELFNKKDRNSDGFLSDSEFMAGQKDPQQAKERFRKFDVDRDGKLNRKEFVTSGKTAG
jgi:Ca2+-binding EF-hand superfamily protein